MPFLIGIDETILGLAEQRRLIPDDVVQVGLNASIFDLTCFELSHLMWCGGH